MRLRLKCKLGIQQTSDLSHAWQPSCSIDYDDASFIWYVSVVQNGSESSSLFFSSFVMELRAGMLFPQSDNFMLDAD